MTTIVRALKNLYRKLGGTDSGTNSISGMINKVADVAGGGSAGGMVIHATATIPNGALGPVISVTDATAGEIFEAMSGGSNVVMVMQLTTVDGTESDVIQIIYTIIAPNGSYEFGFIGGNKTLALEAASASDYPTFGDDTSPNNS